MSSGGMPGSKRKQTRGTKQVKVDSKRPRKAPKEEEEEEEEVIVLSKAAGGGTKEEEEEEVENVNATLNEDNFEPILSMDDSRLPECFGKFFKVSGGKFTDPTTVQSYCWPHLSNGRDLLGIAPTGSGKTLAFLLPALEHTLKTRTGPCRFHSPTVLVLAPTRELASQIQSVASKMHRPFGVYTAAAYGGKDRKAQVEKLEEICRTGSGLGMLIATPGRALDLIGTSDIVLSATSMLVLDECDRMLDLGFEPQMQMIFKHLLEDPLNSEVLKTQNILFSATFPEKLRIVVDRFRLLIRNPVTVRVDPVSAKCDVIAGIPAGKNETSARGIIDSSNEGVDLEAIDGAKKKRDRPVDREIGGRSFADAVSPSIHQIVQVCAEHKKPRKLIRFIEKVREDDKKAGRRVASAMLIFCTKIKTVQFVDTFLRVRQKIPFCGTLHGGMDQKSREAALKYFKAGKIRILVATDVAGRGIDIKNLPYVVNYDFPATLQTYAHRIGRTGRNDQPGTAFSFFTRNFANLAKDLVQLLKSCKQNVEPNLLEISESPELYENKQKKKKNEKRRESTAAAKESKKSGSISSKGQKEETEVNDLGEDEIGENDS